MFGYVRPRFGNGLGHFAQDVDAAFVRLSQRVFHDFFGDGGNFDVHLQSGYAVFGSGNLEVHVAQVVFVTQNVGEDGNPAVVFFDQAHGNTGNRFGHRHAGSHQ